MQPTANRLLIVSCFLLRRQAPPLDVPGEVMHTAGGGKDGRTAGSERQAYEIVS
jgi:hypothetical protein